MAGSTRDFAVKTAETMYVDQQEDVHEVSDNLKQGLEDSSPQHCQPESELLLPPALDLPESDDKRASVSTSDPLSPRASPLIQGRYIYKPLRSKDDIRLVSVTISDIDDDLYFQLTRQDRRDCPAYEAVSYTWGSTARTKTIFHAFSGLALLVTENCEAALRALHRDGKNRLLWLDSISINQDDVVERSHQVSIMDDVFRNATRTIAYLGPEDAHTLALSRWPDIRQLTNRVAPVALEAASLRAYQHLEALLTRPWFTRTWVIQEVLLSKHTQLQAGSHMIDFAEICDLLRRHGTHRVKDLGIMDMYIHYGNEYTTKARHAHRLAWPGPRTSWRTSALQSAVPSKGYLQYWRLFKLLLETASYQCRDPRDKLYALISLFDGEPPIELRPDYSLCVEDVYANISRYLIYSDDMTLALSAAHGVNDTGDMPSWAIDWRDGPTMDSLLYGRLGDRTRYRAGMETGHQHIPALSSSGRSIRIRGIRVASIHFKLSRDTQIAHVSALRGNDMRGIVWFLRPGFNPPPMTSDYHIPSTTLPLDFVCVFIGFEVPFVIRKVDWAWRLVGECDIEEIMYGQALAGIDWHTVDAHDPIWPLEDFILV